MKLSLFVGDESRPNPNHNPTILNDGVVHEFEEPFRVAFRTDCADFRAGAVFHRFGGVSCALRGVVPEIYIQY